MAALSQAGRIGPYSCFGSIYIIDFDLFLKFNCEQYRPNLLPFANFVTDLKYPNHWGGSMISLKCGFSL